LARGGLHRYYVEAARVPGPAGFLLQKMFGGRDQALALARVDAFQGSAPVLMPTAANFDEYYCIAVQHDQIELAAAAAPVLCQQAQPLALQMLKREELGAASELLCVTVPAQIPLFSSG